MFAWARVNPTCARAPHRSELAVRPTAAERDPTTVAAVLDVDGACTVRALLACHARVRRATRNCPRVGPRGGRDGEVARADVRTCGRVGLGVWSFWASCWSVRSPPADQLGGPICTETARRLARASWCDSLTRRQHRVGPDLDRCPAYSAACSGLRVRRYGSIQPEKRSRNSGATPSSFTTAAWTSSAATRT